MNLISKIAAVSISLLLLSTPGISFASIANESPSNNTNKDIVLNNFRNNLKEKARYGNKDNIEQLKRFDKLNANQRDELADYFLGNIFINTPQSSNYSHQSSQDDIVTRGNFTWETERTSDSTSGIETRATKSTKHVKATQWFKFLGITISETKVSGTYLVSGGKAVSIKSYACTVLQNLDPLANISSSKNGSYISDGKATMECKVVVKRGAPTPWGGLNWSTREGIQYLTANGQGKVEEEGWL